MLCFYMYGNVINTGLGCCFNSSPPPLWRQASFHNFTFPFPLYLLRYSMPRCARAYLQFVLAFPGEQETALAGGGGWRWGKGDVLIVSASEDLRIFECLYCEKRTVFSIQRQSPPPPSPSPPLCCLIDCGESNKAKECRVRIEQNM